MSKRDYDKARRIPSVLVFEIAHAGAKAFDAWQKARAASDFPQFAPFLQRNLDLKIHYAECLGYTDRIYDPLLDEYEPDMKTAQIEAIFAKVKKEIVPLVHAIASRQDTADNSFLCRPFDEQKQWDIGMEAAKLLGYDFERGRQDRSPHPFTSSFSINDVRIIIRFMADYFPAVFLPPSMKPDTPSTNRASAKASNGRFWPAAWNARVRDYLGVTPPDDAEGVLQDVHWSHGSFGYFPTYPLGNLFASQLFGQCKKETPGLEASIEKGEFRPLLDWLCARLHVHGRKFTLNELSNKITGKPLQTQPFLAYLKNKYSEIYRL